MLIYNSFHEHMSYIIVKHYDASIYIIDMAMLQEKQ